jgi:hypothetical protein
VLRPSAQPDRPNSLRLIGFLRGMGPEHERPAVGVDESVPFAAIHLLAGIIADGPPASAVLALWLSSTVADGLASRPTRSRSNTPSSRAG